MTGWLEKEPSKSVTSAPLHHQQPELQFENQVSTRSGRQSLGQKQCMGWCKWVDLPTQQIAKEFYSEVCLFLPSTQEIYLQGVQQFCMFLDSLWTWRVIKIVNSNSLLCFSGKSFLNQYKWFPSQAELNPDQNRGSQSAYSVGGLRLGCGSSLFGVNPFLVCVVVLWVDIANMWHLLSFCFSWSF